MTSETQAITDPNGIFTALRSKGAGAKIDAATLDKLDEFWLHAFNLERRALARFAPGQARDRIQCSLAAAILSAIDSAKLPAGHELQGAADQLERQILRITENDLQGLGILPADGEEPQPDPVERLGDPEE